MKNEDLLKDLPQLIVGLDNKNECANYVHIEDVKDGIKYYCPCCKGEIKPRAYKKDEEYKVQPHFYHVTGGCTEESYVHYICKTWLFEKGCKFIVNNSTYVVSSVEVEKTFHTSFGDYRPDITVTTEDNKIFFFEIKYTNKKNELYAPKWDELGCDVAEVDVKEFINSKHVNDVPKFNLIYSNGNCFIKTYSKFDYEETIAKRKLEWKRQDKINYKIKWEKLDWFWNYLCIYKETHENENSVLDIFNNLDFSDMDFVMSVVKRMKCLDLYNKSIPIINDKFREIISNYNLYPFNDFEFNQESKRVFYIGFVIDKIDGYKWEWSYCKNIHYDFYGVDLLNYFNECIEKAKSFKLDFELPYYKNIKDLKVSNTLNDLDFRIYLNERTAIYSKVYNYKYNSRSWMDDYSWKWYISNHVQRNMEGKIIDK